MKQIKIIILLIILVTPLLFFPLVSGGNFSQSPKYYFLSICCSLIAISLKNSFTEIKYITKKSIYLALLILLLSFLISTIFSERFDIGFLGSTQRFEGLVSFVVYSILFICSSLINDICVLRFTAISATIVSLIGVLQKYGVDILPRNFVSDGWTNVAYSTIGNPNFLGSYLVLVLPIAMYEYVGLKKWYGIPIYGLIFYCLLATMSRGPWLGAMFAFGSFAFLMWKYGKFDLKRFSALVVLSLSLILFFNVTSNGALLSRFKTIGNDIGEVVSGGENIEQAGSYRMFIWIRSFELVKQNPIWGVGIEQLGYAFIDNYSDDMIQQFGYVGYIDRAHNEYLHIAVSSGIPSLLLYLIFLMLVLRAGWINLSKNSMLIPVYSAVLGYLLQAFFNISVVSVAYLFWIYLGFLVSVDTRDKTS